MLKARPEDLSWRDVDGEVVLLDERDWRYLHLNGSAALLWRSLADGCTRDQLVATLVAEYDLEFARADADVGAFLNSLTDRELVVES